MSATRITIPHSYGFFETPEITELRKTLAELKTNTIDPRLLELIEFILKHAQTPNTTLKVFEKMKMPFPFGSIAGIDQFFRVSENYKKTLNIITDKTVVLHGLPQHPHIRIDRIYYRCNNTTLIFPFITIIQKESGKKEYFFPGNPLSREISRMKEQSQVAGIEHATKDANLSEAAPLSQTYWDSDGMEKVPFGVLSAEQHKSSVLPIQVYEQTIDPIILGQFAAAIKKLYIGKKLITLLDVGAGNGRLAKKILSQATAMNVPVQYLFLEPSEKQIEKAKTHLAAEMKSDLHTVRFINNTLMKVKTSLNIDCIISCGGPLNAGVATHEQSAQNLNKMQTLIADNGVLIATGLTTLNVDGEDFKRSGFSVLTFTVPYKEEYNPQNNDTISKMFAHQHFPCYVAEKIPTVGPKQERSSNFFRTLRASGQEQAVFAADELEMLAEDDVELWRPSPLG